MMTVPVLILFGALMPHLVPLAEWPTKAADTSQAGNTDTVSLAVRQALDGILSDLKRLKSVYPQLIHIDGAEIDDSHLSYQNGRINCGGKASPCTFSAPDACRVMIGISHINSRAEAEGHASPPAALYDLPDGTYLEIEYNVLAAPTSKGKMFSRRVESLIMARMEVLRKQVARAGH